jgi:hypothetical protein
MHNKIITLDFLFRLDNHDGIVENKDLFFMSGLYPLLTEPGI